MNSCIALMDIIVPIFWKTFFDISQCHVLVVPPPPPPPPPSYKRTGTESEDILNTGLEHVPPPSSTHTHTNWTVGKYCNLTELISYKTQLMTITGLRWATFPRGQINWENAFSQQLAFSIPSTTQGYLRMTMMKQSHTCMMQISTSAHCVCVIVLCVLLCQYSFMCGCHSIFYASFTCYYFVHH